MKKIILTTVAFLAFGFANAQETVIVVQEPATGLGMAEGNMWAEGYFKYSSTSDETKTLESTFSFTPQIGYMLTDEWGVGGYLAFTGSNYNSASALDKSGSWGIGAFARYYFLSLGKQKSFQAYAEAGLGYSALTKDFKVGGSDTNSAMNGHINIGLNYFFTSHFAATFVLANVVSYNNPNASEFNDDLSVNINLFENIFDTPQFGLLYKW